MLAGQRYPKLLAPRGRGFIWLENHAPIDSMPSDRMPAVAASTRRSRKRSDGIAVIADAASAAPCRQILHAGPRARTARRCAPGRAVADRRVLPEPGRASFTRTKNEE